MKKYNVVDLQGCNFMDDTYDEPMTMEDLRERFWNLEDANTEKYEEFTPEYIEMIWGVRFEEVENETRI